MSIITLILVLVLVGVAIYLINKIPMEQSIKTILNIVIVIIVLIWLLKAFGLFSNVNDLKI